MSSLNELISKAQHLRSEGHSAGQIADELSLSMETVTWLLTQEKGGDAPKDVHIDWTVVSGNADLMEQSAMMMLSQLYIESDSFTHTVKKPDTVIGIAISGIPLATVMALHEKAKLAVYHPAKHSNSETPVGSMGGNFADITGRKCIVVDDVITSGNTLHEVVAYLKHHGATPLACCTLFDKRGIKEIDGVPVYSLYKISRID